MKLYRLFMSIHRILGTALSILFLMWFLSGMVMMYRPYPSVSQEQRVQHSERLAPCGVELPRQLPNGLTSLSLQQIAGRPVFLMTNNDLESQIDALTGQPIIRYSVEKLQAIVDRWQAPSASISSSLPAKDSLGCPSVAPITATLLDSLNEIDVWLIGAMPFKEFPIYHYLLNDGRGSELYLSSRTGRVLQLTDRESRFWAWVGAIPHWIYITQLRATGRQPWTNTVLWLSGFGIFMIISGIVVGLHSLLSARRRKKGGLSPYIMPLFRWHHLFGLFFGLFVLTWIFSGFMSLADAPQCLWPVHDERTARQLYADTLKTERFRLDIDRVLTADDVRRVEWMEMGLRPYYHVWTAGDEYLVDAADTVPRRVTLSEADCRMVVQRTHHASVRITATMMNHYDNYYVSQKRMLPLPVCRVTVDDADCSTYYINPRTGDSRYYNTNRRAGKWMYSGLHALNISFFIAHPTLRLILMWILMLGGTIVSFTGLLLSLRYLRRKKRTF